MIKAMDAWELSQDYQRHMEAMREMYSRIFFSAKKSETEVRIPGKDFNPNIGMELNLLGYDIKQVGADYLISWDRSPKAITRKI